MSKIINDILLIGGGGHCASCIEIIESLVDYNISGIIDSSEKIGESILSHSVIGTDRDLLLLRNKYSVALITVGQIKNAETRLKIYKNLQKLQFHLPVIIAITAYVSRHSVIGNGTIIMNQAFVNSRTKVGVNCILNTKSTLEHDVIIGDHCHISTNVIINGNCSIGDECFIGSGSILKNGVSIVSRTIIGAGSLVLKNIIEAGIYAGNPLRKIE